MKLPRLLSFFVILASAAAAADVFPGLKGVMTEAEWKRAGLGQLTPDQLGVIDAVLIKYFGQTFRADASPALASLPPMPAAGATPAETAAARSRFWEKFGFGKTAATPDWRTLPPMTAKVTAWRGSNGFVLDNGQVWEGIESIPFDLPGNSVIIEARPLDAFALKLNENSAAMRVRRVQ